MIDFNNKRVLITGGAGFIGANICKYLQNNYPKCEIVIFDKFQTDSIQSPYKLDSLGNYRNILDFKGTILVGDIANRNELEQLNSYKFDFIFHQAAISDTTIIDQNKVIKTNTSSLIFFIEKAILDNSKFVYASSAGTYGNSPAPNKVGCGEIPENVYGFSKLMMDQIALSYMKRGVSNIVGLRYFNVYGPGEYFKGKTASMILQLGLQMLSGSKPKLFKWGEQRRDFVYIKDVVQANIKALEAPSGIYNVGFGEARSFLDIVNILEKNLNISTQIDFIENPYSFYQNHTCADINDTINFLDYKPEFTLEKGISDYHHEIIKISEDLKS